MQRPRYEDNAMLLYLSHHPVGQVEEAKEGIGQEVKEIVIEMRRRMACD